MAGGWGSGSGSRRKRQLLGCSLSGCWADILCARLAWLRDNNENERQCIERNEARRENSIYIYNVLISRNDTKVLQHQDLGEGVAIILRLTCIHKVSASPCTTLNRLRIRKNPIFIHKTSYSNLADWLSNVCNQPRRPRQTGLVK